MQSKIIAYKTTGEQTRQTALRRTNKGKGIAKIPTNRIRLF